MIGILPLRTEVELKKLPVETLKFILICALVHVVTWRIALVPYEYGALRNWFDLTGYHYWFPPSALSCIFVHANFSHIFFNMFFLFLFAAPLELAEGKRKFWTLVVFAALFSSYFQTFALWMFSLWTHSPDPWVEWLKQNQIEFSGIGASGVVSAFAMAYLVRFWRKKLHGMITIFGIPIPKMLPIPAWVLVLAFWLIKDLVGGFYYQGLLAAGGIGHLCHLGGDLAGLILAFKWGYQKKHKRDYYLEHAEDSAKAPITGGLAAYTTYKQALACDPDNGSVLLETARSSYHLGRSEESKDYYRKAVLALSREGALQETVAAYLEAFERHQLIFLSDHQLELVRLLILKNKWKTAGKCLGRLCEAIEAKGLVQAQSSLSIRAKLILAWVLDHYENRIPAARVLIENLLRDFPNHPLLKYPAQRLAHYGETDELFHFNPGRPGFPFSSARPIADQANTRDRKKIAWYQVRKKFMIKFGLGLAAAPVAIIILFWALFVFLCAVGGVFGFYLNQLVA